MAVVGRRVQYLGNVQGVGFRRRAERLAQDLPVAGYVRNLADGSVELVVEGDELSVRTLLERVQTRMSSEIAETLESDAAVEGFSDFVIRR